MASRPDELISVATVAQEFEVSEDHVAKVLQQLVRARIVRGVRGGYRLEVSPPRAEHAAVGDHRDAGGRHGARTQRDGGGPALPV